MTSAVPYGGERERVPENRRPSAPAVMIPIMTASFRDPLRLALGTTFQLGRELGRGGVRRVFIAGDIALAARLPHPGPAWTVFGSRPRQRRNGVGCTMWALA